MDRQAEKELARQKDQADLKSGRTSTEDLRRKNGRFVFPDAKILWDKAKALK